MDASACLVLAPVAQVGMEAERVFTHTVERAGRQAPALQIFSDAGTVGRGLTPEGLQLVARAGSHSSSLPSG